VGPVGTAGAAVALLNANVRAGLNDDPRHDKPACTDNVPVVKAGKFILTWLFNGGSIGVITAPPTEKLHTYVSTPAGAGPVTLYICPVAPEHWVADPVMPAGVDTVPLLKLHLLLLVPQPFMPCTQML
jgi:hypothetical protein